MTEERLTPLGAYIRKLLRARDLQQGQLASMLKVSEGQLSSWLTGSTSMSDENRNAFVVETSRILNLNTSEHSTLNAVANVSRTSGHRINLSGCTAAQIELFNVVCQRVRGLDAERCEKAIEVVT